MRLRVSVVSGIVLLFTTNAPAHHSFARYYLSTEIEVSGTVRELEWANPHVYLYVAGEADGGETVEWQVEGQPPSILRRFGWTPEVLSVGDSVIVTGRPSRDDARKEILGVSVRKSDGARLTMNFDIPTLANRGAASSSVANDLSGTWLSILGAGNPQVREILAGPRTWQLTDKGQQAVSDFNQESMLPAIECTPYAAPFMMVLPDIKIFEIGEDVVLLRTEYEGVERTIHMNVTTHEGAEPTPQGHSIGRWDGDALVVDTANFSDHGSGNALGLPSGAGKHLVERFELNADGKSLTYSFRLEDPEYLAAPIESGDMLWVYRPELDYAPAECRQDNARRFVGD
jgi:hypothetical protein